MFKGKLGKHEWEQAQWQFFDNLTYSSIARDFGVHPSTIRRGLAKHLKAAQLRESPYAARVRELLVSSLLGRWLTETSAPTSVAAKVMADPSAHLTLNEYLEISDIVNQFLKLVEKRQALGHLRTNRAAL